MDAEMKAEFSSLREEMNSRFEEVNARFEKMQNENNKWFLKIYHQGTGIEARIDALEERVTALEKEY